MTKIKYFPIILLYSLFFVSNGISQENYLSEGKKLFNKQKYLESKFKFEQAIVFNPKHERSYLYLAKIFKQEEKDGLEEQNLKAVILLNPQNEEALYLLTLLKIKKSDYEESDKLIKKFKKICKKICDKEVELKNKFQRLKTK